MVNISGRNELISYKAALMIGTSLTAAKDQWLWLGEESLQAAIYSS